MGKARARVRMMEGTVVRDEVRCGKAQYATRIVDTGESSYKSIVSRTQDWAWGREGDAIHGIRGRWDVPFEFESEITGTSAMAEACDIESCTTSTRHFDAFSY